MLSTWRQSRFGDQRPRDGAPPGHTGDCQFIRKNYDLFSHLSQGGHSVHLPSGHPRKTKVTCVNLNLLPSAGLTPPRMGERQSLTEKHHLCFRYAEGHGDKAAGSQRDTKPNGHHGLWLTDRKLRKMTGPCPPTPGQLSLRENHCQKAPVKRIGNK